MVEEWKEERSGVLHTEPLLLSACRAGAFGTGLSYPGGGVYSALFTFLCGEANRELFNTRPELFFDKWLVCMSGSWEALIRKRALRMILRRVMMRPRRGVSAKTLTRLPEDFAVVGYTPEIFMRHPFGHGENYRDFLDFARRGSGAAALCGDTVAASASSFLTFGQDVELDMSTLPEYRRKGLADHCVARMMADCAARGLTIHWDAQNDASVHMAEQHGFLPEQDYAVYVLKAGF